MLLLWPWNVNPEQSITRYLAFPHKVLQALCNGSTLNLLSGTEAQAVATAVPLSASNTLPLRQAALALLHNIGLGILSSGGRGGNPALLHTMMKAAATGLDKEQDSLCKQLRLVSLAVLLSSQGKDAACVSKVRELRLQGLARAAASTSKSKEERGAAGFLFIQTSKYFAATN